MKARAVTPQTGAAPRPGPDPSWEDDRGGLVGYLSQVSAARGMKPIDVARLMNPPMSGQHFFQVRRGETSVRAFAERWATVLGVDLSDDDLLRAVHGEFLDRLKDRLVDPGTPALDKVLFLDDLARSLEMRVPVRVTNLYFDFYEDITPTQPRPMYLLKTTGDFPPVGSNPARFKRPR